LKVQTVHTAFWRRVDAPGHDACRLVSDESGWSLDGTAVFLRDGDPAQLVYHLDGDPAWRTRRGTVRGFVGSLVADVSVVRSEGGLWTMNGRVVAGLEDCVHLDYSFTPSTNLPHVRRMALAGQESAEVPVAWLDLPLATLAQLPQRYSRRNEAAYWYEAPTVGYAAELEFAPTGFVRSYPGLWEAVG
jgi:uncharacterized protein